MSAKDWIGWASSLLLVITFGSQTYIQWRDRSKQGKPGTGTFIFFSAAIGGTLGNMVYSYLLDNWVFTILNAVLAVNNGVGLAIAVYRRERKGSDPREGTERDGKETASAA